MDDNDIEFAAKFYQKQKKQGGCTFDLFYKAILEHKRRRPSPYDSFDPMSMCYTSKKLWDLLTMDMRELVARSGKDMAKFARRYCIPYRTLQAWCDGTNECPVYIKLLIGESMSMFTRTVLIDLYGR